MANEVPEVELGPICSKIGSGSTPRGGGEVYLAKSDVALIRSQNVHNDGFKTDGLVYIGEEHADKLANVTAEPQDVLLNITGDSVARCCQVDPTILPARVNQHVALIRPRPSELNPRFLRYFLVSPRMQSQMLGWARAGATRNALTKRMIESFKVPKPPIVVQRRIAHVLGTLDDKIELNRRMNQTLEKMAAAIFKSWFIDFDPVRAKAEGRDTGLPTKIADLFPDSFEDSQPGPIPEGWKTGILGDIADNPRRGVNPADVPPATPYIGLEHMPRKCIALDAWGRADEVASGKSRFKQGEILFGKLRPYFHKVSLAPVDGVCSTDIVIIVPKANRWHGFVMSLVSSKAFVDYTDTHSAGTKMPRTNWTDMSRYLIAVPPEPLAKAFQEHVSPLHERIALNVRQNRRLAGLRDTLLPRLLSGEIDVTALDGVAEEVTVTQPAVAPGPAPAKAGGKSRKATDQFQEAILIAALVRQLADAEHPIGRMRYTKLSYLIHRRIGHKVTDMYLKKAAGPYNPATRYRGPEKIALEKSYITAVGNSAFGTGDNAAQTEQYLNRYDFKDALDWAIRTFRYRKTEDLELLATVDYATLELRSAGRPANVPNIRKLLATTPDWAPKLNRELFSDANIQRALDELARLFSEDGGVSK